MNFKPINLDNLHQLFPYLEKQSYRLCDYSLLSLYIWKDFYQYEYSIHAGFLYIRGFFDGTLRYMIPVGNTNINNAILSLKQYTKNQGHSLEFGYVPTPALKLLQTNNNDLIIKPTFFDYVYKIVDLIKLKGIKYKRQRNHINKFQKLYKNYQYKKVSSQDIPKILEFLDEFSLEMSDRYCDKSFVYELEKTRDVINNFELLNPVGGILIVDDKVVALAMGEIMNDTIYIHIEKALRKYPGSYAVINREFLQNNYHESIQYVNREEDMGDEGLRKAKQSYRPIMLLEKYHVKVKESD